MALHNDQRLYTGGAVVFNNQPSVNLYAQLLQRRQAKRDALDQYYTKALSDVTSSGMRNKDVVGGWSKKLNDLQTFGMNLDNRKYLVNPRLDDYKTVTEFNRMHQDLLQDAERSKLELKDENLINQQRISGKWNPTDSDLEVAHKKGLSIYDPQRMDEMGNEPDLTQLSFNVPEFTPLQEQQLYKSASQGIDKSKTYDEKNIRTDDKGEQYLPVTYKHELRQLKVIGDNVGNNLTKSALVKYENLMHNSEAYETATKAYQQVYGENELIDTPVKMAKAIAIIHAMGETKTLEEKMPDWMLRTQINQANSMNKIAANQRGVSGGGSGQGNLFHKIDLSKYGNPKQGRIDAFPAKDLPADIEAVLKSAGTDISKAQNFTIEIENGDIVAITPNITNGKRVDIVAMANAQEKWNTQGQKQVQPDFEQKIDKVKQPNPGGQNKKPKQKDSLGIRDK